MRFFHGRLDGKDEADAFERENRTSDCEREVARVEKSDGVVEAFVGDGKDVEVVDVAQSEENADVC